MGLIAFCYKIIGVRGVSFMTKRNVFVFCDKTQYREGFSFPGAQMGAPKVD